MTGCGRRCCRRRPNRPLTLVHSHSRPRVRGLARLAGSMSRRRRQGWRGELLLRGKRPQHRRDLCSGRCVCSCAGVYLPGLSDCLPSLHSTREPDRLDLTISPPCGTWRRGGARRVPVHLFPNPRLALGEPCYPAFDPLTPSSPHQAAHTTTVHACMCLYGVQISGRQWHMLTWHSTVLGECKQDQDAGRQLRGLGSRGMV